jgi:NitT/TauT family transport system permease protein
MRINGLKKDKLAPEARATGAKPRRLARIRLTQLILIAAFVCGWQYLPTVSWLQERSHIFDRYFVSSPSDIAIKLYDLATGHNGVTFVWPYVWHTVFASLLGTIIGMVLGAVCGLVLSNFKFASSVFRPFVVALNATPRIALVPIIIIFFGPNLATSVVIAFLVVFFVAFFNGYEGGISVRQELLHNARLLGARERQVLWTIRMPYVFAWTFASMPLCVTFAIISVVTAEILTGYTGMGFLLQSAETTADSSLTFAVVVLLAVVGLLVVTAAELFRKRVLHWWNP